MKRTGLPKADVSTRPGVESHISPMALQRWCPSVRAAADDDGATISILDPIGQDMWGDGVSAKRIAGALRAIGAVPVTVNINSPGGDFFEGLAIYNLLLNHPEKVTVQIMGIAASAASVIAMAGDEIKIARAGFLMIHNTRIGASGDRHALAEVSEWLRQFDDMSVDIYAARSGLDKADLAGRLDRETWIGGQAAVDQGFAEGLLPADLVDTGDVQESAGMRAERKFDVMAKRSGLSNADKREMLKSLKSGTPGAALPGTPGAADLTQGLSELLSQLKNVKV
jgi:ATP-dependent Clp protease protease subunit